MSTALAKASTRPDDRFVALPFYLLCDVSGSVAGPMCWSGRIVRE